MSIYALHKLLFDLRSRSSIKIAFMNDPEAVYQNYQLTDAELSALRRKDIYQLLKLGVSTYLLASFAELIGYNLADFRELVAAGWKSEQP
jgi:hypothetical protein